MKKFRQTASIITLFVFVLTMFTGALSAYATDTVYNVTCDSFSRAYVLYGMDEVGITTAKEGETIFVDYKSLNPVVPAGQYLTGEFNVDGQSVCAGGSFVMPANDVNVSAVLAQQRNITVDFRKETVSISDDDMMFISDIYDKNKGSLAKNLGDNKTGLDFNFDGTEDVIIVHSDSGNRATIVTDSKKMLTKMVTWEKTQGPFDIIGKFTFIFATATTNTAANNTNSQASQTVKPDSGGTANGTGTVNKSNLTVKSDKDTKDIVIKKIKAASTIKKTKNYKITVTLSKKVKGKYVYVIFNGKTYKAKTNGKGVAKITIKKSVLKKLVGKKVKYQVVFNQSLKNKRVKIKK